MNNVKFSVIIPTYNSRNEVQNAIKSVQAQNFKNYEIIVVDDCSTDNTQQVLSGIQNIKVIRNEENLKAGGSRNRGIKASNGEYIIFLDADDYLKDTDTLQKINDVIGNEQPDIVYLGFEVLGKNGIKETWIPTQENSTFEERTKNWKYENVWDVCWNKSFLLKNNIKFAEKKFFEDFPFYYNGLINAKSYKVASFITHVYTMLKDDSMTAKVSETKLQDLYYNVSEFLEIAKKVDNTKKPSVIYAIYRVVEYSTRLLLSYQSKIAQDNLKQELELQYKDLIEKYQQSSKNSDMQNTASKDVVWVFWWQELENAPKVVKKCVESMKKYCGGREIVVISQKNYREFVTLPDYIEKKFNDKKISITHFSDILRINLLSKYGGLWLDATCLLTGNISDYLKSDFFTIKLPYNEKEKCVSQGKWCVFCMYGKPHNMLFDFMKDFYDIYWKNEDKVKDYFIMDYAIEVAYENIEKIRNMIDNVPQTNDNIHMLKEIMNEKYNEEIYRKLMETNKIHKLDRSKEYFLTTADGVETFYGHVMK